MRVGVLERCLKVGKLTKKCAKLTKSGGIALVEVGEMCKKLEKLRRKKRQRDKGPKGQRGRSVLSFRRVKGEGGSRRGGIMNYEVRNVLGPEPTLGPLPTTCRGRQGGVKIFEKIGACH